MGIDSAPNIGALKGSAEADFGRNFWGKFLAGGFGENFSGGNFFWEGL